MKAKYDFEIDKDIIFEIKKAIKFWFIGKWTIPAQKRTLPLRIKGYVMIDTDQASPFKVVITNIFGCQVADNQEIDVRMA